MDPAPFMLFSERLMLRRFRADDLPTLLEYCNDPDIARYQGWSSLSVADARAFLEAQRVQPVAEPGQKFGIALERRADARHLGDLALRTDGAGGAEVGYTLARPFQGRGYMTEAVVRLLEYLFTDLGLHRVAARADVRNAASVRVLERLGFRREAHFVEAVYVKGEWTSEYLYALLGREWRART